MSFAIYIFIKINIGFLFLNNFQKFFFINYYINNKNIYLCLCKEDVT